MDNLSVAELEQHAAMLQEKVLAVAADVKALLAEDLPKFVERELKRSFVSNPEFASSVSDERLHELKQAIREGGVAGAKKVASALEDDELWLPADAGDPEVRKSISENKPLWEQVNKICDVIKELEERFDIPREPRYYKPPTWFIGRRYLPSLSEKYWRGVAELAVARGRIHKIQAETSRSELARRWDDVE